MSNTIHLNLDDAWDGSLLPFPTLDARKWGPRLRYHGTRGEIEAFWREVGSPLAPFVVYGSGDFHHLAALLLRRATTPVTVVSFDNHPDWDIRPPRWACGGWVNRALELPHVRRVTVWGCGNFELRWPSRLFANRSGISSGRLEVHAWAERQPLSVRRRFPCVSRDDWQARFDNFVAELRDSEVYITIDLDCLRAEEAVTNWENGLFAAADVAWAVRRLRQESRVVGGDVCGAYSPPRYARWFQRFAGNWDHPKLAAVDEAQARLLNHAALDQILPALCGAPPVARATSPC